MRVIAMHSFGSEEVLVEEDWPLPVPSAGQVRVRIDAASFNPIDLYWRSGRLDQRLPVVLGRDFAGTIDALGDGVDDLRIGDAVFGYQAGLASNGSYAEMTCLPAALVARRPRAWSAAQCAALPVAGLTAYKAVFEKARLAPGAAILVAGASGGVGAMIVQLARLAKTGRILATTGSERSQNILTSQLGLDPADIISYPDRTVAQMAAQIRERLGGRGVAAAFDTAGGDMKRLCFDAVAADGDVVSIVEEPADYPLNIWDERTSPLSQRSLSFHFVELSARARSGDPGALAFYRNALNWLTGQADAGHLAPPFTLDMGALSAETAQQAHRLLATRQAGGKLVMTIGGER